MKPCPPDNIRTELGCIPENPIGFVEKIYSIGIAIIGMVGLLFMIIGGYYIVTSQGNPERLQTGKSYILYSLIGILLAIFGFIFIEVIGGDILRIPGIS